MPFLKLKDKKIKKVTMKQKRKYWTKEEDALLIELVTKSKQENGNFGGKISWKNIAESMGERIGKQCRGRYMNYLDPKIKALEWTECEIKILFQEYDEKPQKWSDISKKLAGRSANAIKNKYHSLKNKIPKAEKNNAVAHETGVNTTHANANATAKAAVITTTNSNTNTNTTTTISTTANIHAAVADSTRANKVSHNNDGSNLLDIVDTGGNGYQGTTITFPNGLFSTSSSNSVSKKRTYINCWERPSATGSYCGSLTSEDSSQQQQKPKRQKLEESENKINCFSSSTSPPSWNSIQPMDAVYDMTYSPLPCPYNSDQLIFDDQEVVLKRKQKENDAFNELSLISISPNHYNHTPTATTDDYHYSNFVSPAVIKNNIFSGICEDKDYKFIRIDGSPIVFRGYNDLLAV